MKQNGDLYLFALIYCTVGFISGCMGVNLALRDPHGASGYFAIIAGVLLCLFGWFVVSSAVFRVQGTTPWWSSRRLFKLSKHETKLG
jgi:sulfite exporter TauE/SafE